MLTRYVPRRSRRVGIGARPVRPTVTVTVRGRAPRRWKRSVISPLRLQRKRSRRARRSIAQRGA
jgi:hypothetical protein